MKDRRLQIKEALESLIYSQRHRDFQRLAVHLAKTKWPELEATQEQDDGGEDATAFFKGADGVRRRLACSITGTLGKVKQDAARLKERSVQLDVLVFMTPVPVTNLTISTWCEAIQKEFGYGLHVVPESELITLLEQPQNVWLCRDYLGLRVEDEPLLAQLEASARAGAVELLKGWKSEYRFDPANAIALDLIQEPAEREKARSRQAQAAAISFQDIAKMIAAGDRILLIGAPGAGKTFTLIQAADFLLQQAIARIPILVSLPAWALSGMDFPAYLTKQLEGHGLQGDWVDKLINAGRLAFFLNGWNEIPDAFVDGATTKLRSFALSRPAAALILSTREGRVASPLSSVRLIRVRPLSAQQKREMIKKSAIASPSTLIRELETNVALAEVTDIPLFLTAVVGLARSGAPLPNTRSGLLKKSIEQIEGSSEHSAALNVAPCAGLHRHYLSRIAAKMTQDGRTTLAFDDLLAAIAQCSSTLQDQKYLTHAPSSPSVANCLVNHHLLVLSSSTGGGYRFVHQQFQEWFAAEWLCPRVVELAKDEKPDAIFELSHDVLNHVRWQQPLSFLLERLAEDEGEQLPVAAKLIHWAMDVDFVVAAELAGIAGKKVWPLIRHELGTSLRKWYETKSDWHRQCALAAILATKTADFQDLLWPLLESPDMQVRLGTYRTRRPFPMATLGANWRERFDKWNTDQKFELIEAVDWQPGEDHIALACELAKSDRNLDVRLACLRLLNNAGASATCAEIVAAPEFVEWAKSLPDDLLPRLPKRCLGPLVPRLKAALADMQDLNRRQAIIGTLHWLDDPDSQDLMKTEMDRILKKEGVELRLSNDQPGLPIQKSDLPNAAPMLGRYLDLVHRVSPDWALTWLCDQLVQGRLWWEPFTGYLPQIPKSAMQKLTTVALDAGVDVNTISGRARQIGRSGSTFAAEAVLIQYLSLQATKESQVSGQSFTRRQALELGLNEVPLPILVDVVVEKAGSFQDFQHLRDLVSSVMSRNAFDSALRAELSQHQKDSLRSLVLKLEQIRPVGLNDLRWFRASQAILIGAIGRPQDAQLLEAWIHDEMRFREDEVTEWKSSWHAWEAGGRKGRSPGGLCTTEWRNRYRDALVQLGCQEAGEVLLRLLHSREFVGEAALGLALLAQNDNGAPSSDFAPHPQYSQIYELRRHRQTKSMAGEPRHYADAILEAAQNLFTELDKTGSKGSVGELNKTVLALAALDDLRVMPFLQQIASNKNSGWTIAMALHGLVLRGVVVPGKEAAQALEPFMAAHEKVPRGGEPDNWYHVVRCLAVLLFSDTPAFGVERIRRLPPERLKAYYIREIFRLLGASRAPEAGELLVELAGVREIHRHYFYELVTALSENENAKARRHLLDLFDILRSGKLPQPHDARRALSKAIAHAAKIDDFVRAGIESRCENARSTFERGILCDTLQEIGDDDAALTLCKLIHDEFPITYDVARLVETVATTHVPAGGNSYYVKPREASALKKRLLHTALNDLSRKLSALELLAVITWCRLEHGYPPNEAFHPDIDALKRIPLPWQLLAA